MVPKFNVDGQLPPGIYLCDWKEFVERFGTTEHRRTLITGLQSAMIQLRSAGCTKIYIGGSLVTSKLVPKDFNACWEEDQVNIKKLKFIAPALLNFDAKRRIQKKIYRGEFFPTGLPADEYGYSFLEFFQTDRSLNPKGIITIDLVEWVND